MRFRTFVLAGTTALVLASAPPVLAADVVDRVQVGVPTLPATKAFAPNLSVAFEAPSGFERGCCYNFFSGEWLGPQYAVSTAPGFTNASSIRWQVDHVGTARSAKKVARRAGWSGLPQVSGRRLRVPHVVSGETVGRIPAYLVLDAEARPGARGQASIAVDLGRRLKMVATFTVGAPQSDTTDDGGAVTVNGRRASTFNRAQLKAAARSVYVEGSLPPRRVSVDPSGSTLFGSVRDQYRDPVAETPIVLQRRAGGSWTNAADGATSLSGTFRFEGLAAGRYRVIATLAGASASSAAARVR